METGNSSLSCACRNGKLRHDGRRKNIITIAWTGTINSDPAMTYISVRPERHSHKIIKETGEFVINLTTRELVEKCDFCGVKKRGGHEQV